MSTLTYFQVKGMAKSITMNNCALAKEIAMNNCHLITQRLVMTPNTTVTNGAHALWHKVLRVAIEDLDDKHHRAPAMRWFISNSETIGSFLWVCEQLDVDPQLIRTKLSRKIYYLFN